MSSVELIVCGAHGRMGKEVVRLAETVPWVKKVTQVDHRGRGDVRRLTDLQPRGAAVVVDFSLPAALAKNLKWCEQNKIACVVGVTGLTPAQNKNIQRASQSIPVLWAPNMSLGANVVYLLIQKLAQWLPDYDWQIEEAHHSQKRDAPSGTAKWLQGAAERSLKKKMPPIASFRGGGIFGIHKLWIMGQEETITIEHTATQRALFARGALTAAQWLLGRRKGLYSMQDVLNAK